MNLHLRLLLNRVFTALAYLSVLLMAGALAVILGPILWKGSGAVVFQGTAEFRRMQWEQFQRGKPAEVEAEQAQIRQARQPIYDILERFRQGIDTDQLTQQVRQLNRELGKQLRHRELPSEEIAQIRQVGMVIRDTLEEAFGLTDKKMVLARLDAVLNHPQRQLLEGTVAQEMFTLAQQYHTIATTVDLGRRQEYAAALGEVQDSLRNLLGPLPGEAASALVMNQYGALRWDRAALYREKLLWADRWVADEPGMPLRKERVSRKTLFTGTEMVQVLDLAEAHLSEMLNPRWTFYGSYFWDNDKTTGHYIGGVGPEIIGTFLITVLAMVFAVPLGIISAAYLIECAGDNLLVRVIRTCVNTLAGVPSIVFGLFGLAFFVLYFLPKFGLPRGSSIWAGAMTLSLLVLPVIIRASEEAIRAVPITFKEASLALGASKLRTFIMVQLPVALPGILTGIILSMSRAAGETAPILFTAAVAVGPIPESLSEPTKTLSYSSYDIAVGDAVGAMVPHNQFGMVMTLVLLVLVLNILAIMLRSRLARKLRGQ